MLGTDIAKSQMLLEKGEVVAIPTETVYGLAANALHLPALAQIFAIKTRSHLHPLTIQTSSIAKATNFVKTFPPKAQQLAAAFWPGPLTLLLEKKPGCVPDLATAGLATVGIRIPDHQLTLRLLQKLPFPLAVPSANLSGHLSPTTAQHVQAQLGNKVSYILDGGPCWLGIESTIIGFRGNSAVLYRLGYITKQAIEKIIGPVKQGSNLQPTSVASITSSYRLHTPLIVGNLSTLLKQYIHQNIATLTFNRPVQDIPAKKQIVLSPKGDLIEAAYHFFAALQYLDSLGVALILASYLPDRGLGRVINNRLEKASIAY